MEAHLKWAMVQIVDSRLLQDKLETLEIHKSLLQCQVKYKEIIAEKVYLTINTILLILLRFSQIPILVVFIESMLFVSILQN
jgi:hypothetical protein